MSLTESETFFAACRDALGRLTWWPDEAPMRSNHHALCAVYRVAGCHHADFEIERHVPMGSAHAFARRHWTLHRRDGSVLQQFHTGCPLMRTADGPRALRAVAHQEDLRTLRGDANH